MDSKIFYDLSMKYLIEKAAAHNVTGASLEDYFVPAPEKKNVYIPDDYIEGTMNNLLWRLLFHAQNTGQKRNVIGLEVREKEFKTVLCDFDYERIISSYENPAELYDSIIKKTGVKKPTDARRSLAYRFARTTFDCCNVLKKYDSYDEFYNTMEREGDYAPLCLSLMIYDYGYALACDFLKELNPRFDFAKPDVHIRGVISEFCPETRKSDDNIESYLVGQKMKEIAGEIGCSVYKLDKIIWLICTETFYNHDNVKNTKSEHREKYIDYLKKAGLKTL